MGAPPPGAESRVLDRADTAALGAALSAFRCEAVVDQVAYTAEDAASLHAVLPPSVTRWILVSSAVVYGPGDGLSEADLPHPDSAFATAKLDAERAALAHAGARVLRLGYLYGPGHAPLTPSGRIADLAERLRRGVPVALPCEIDDTPRLQPLFAEDFAAVVLATLEHPAPPTVLNVTGPETLSWAEALTAWAQAAGAPPPHFERLSFAELQGRAPEAHRPFLGALLRPPTLSRACLVETFPTLPFTRFVDGARAVLR